MRELNLRVERIRETPQRFHLQTDAIWWDELCALFGEPRAQLDRPFALDMEGYRIGERLLFRGRVAGTATFGCSRCAEAYAHPLDEPLELLLEPELRGQEVPDGGIALDPEDLELGHYAGDELNFGAVVLEILALAWPMQPLCREDCLGLCQRCGINRNEEQCSCETGEGDRPFAALERLLQTGQK